MTAAGCSLISTIPGEFTRIFIRFLSCTGGGGVTSSGIGGKTSPIPVLISIVVTTRKNISSKKAISAMGEELISTEELRFFFSSIPFKSKSEERRVGDDCT